MIDWAAKNRWLARCSMGAATVRLTSLTYWGTGWDNASGPIFGARELCRHSFRKESGILIRDIYWTLYHGPWIGRSRPRVLAMEHFSKINQLLFYWASSLNLIYLFKNESHPFQINLVALMGATQSVPLPPGTSSSLEKRQSNGRSNGNFGLRSFSLGRFEGELEISREIQAQYDAIVADINRSLAGNTRSGCAPGVPVTGRSPGGVNCNSLSPSAARQDAQDRRSRGRWTHLRLPQLRKIDSMLYLA